MNDFEKDVVIFFVSEIAMDAGDLVAELDGDMVKLRATKWIEEWPEIMDYVEALDGQWHKAGKGSHWSFEKWRIAERIDFDKANKLWNPRGIKIA